MTLRPWHLLLTLPLALGSCDILLDTENGNLGLTFTSEPVPLLPIGFPIYPKAFSTKSLDGLVGETWWRKPWDRWETQWAAGARVRW